MDKQYEAALRIELDGLRTSPDRPAKYRRIAEVLKQLGEKPLPTDRPPAAEGRPAGRGPKSENTAAGSPLEKAVIGEDA